jgi:hypothetical protein
VRFNNDNGTVTNWQNPSGIWKGTDSNQCINDANTIVNAVRSKGFKVKVPAGQTYGFFIKAYNTSMSTYNKSGKYTSSNYDADELVHTWYSEARHNYDKQGHASFFEQLVEKNGQKVYKTFLGFEDTVCMLRVTRESILDIQRKTETRYIIVISMLMVHIKTVVGWATATITT